MGAGIFAAMQNNQQQQPYQQYPQYEPPIQPYPQGQEPSKSYQQGYRPQPDSYVEGGQAHQYTQQEGQPKQEYDQPQTHNPPQELPPQQ